MSYSSFALWLAFFKILYGLQKVRCNLHLSDMKYPLHVILTQAASLCSVFDAHAFGLGVSFFFTFCSSFATAILDLFAV